MKLAINGGTPYFKGSFPGWPFHDETEERAIMRILAEKSTTPTGGETERFARRFAEYNGTKYCIPVANGTVSIELIMRGLGLSRGDEVILPAYTFIASLSSLIYAGVTPVFADIDPDTFNISPEDAARKLTSKTKAIMPVYVGGRPAELDALENLCRENGLYLIGDAAQAAGSAWRGRPIGSYGIAASFSCQNSKNLNCGEGGIITTNDDGLYNNITAMLSGGKTGGKYTHLAIDSGISDYQSAILNTQLDRLEEQIDLRMKNAATLDKLLCARPYARPLKRDERITRNTYHLYCFALDSAALQGVSRERFVSAVNAEGIPLCCGYSPVYEFDCVKGAYAEKQVGARIDTSHQKNDSEIGHNEGCWLYHATLLGDDEATNEIVSAMDKVYENIDELK